MIPPADALVLGIHPKLRVSAELIPGASIPPVPCDTVSHTPRRRIDDGRGLPPTWELTDVALFPEAVACFPSAGFWKRIRVQSKLFPPVRSEASV